MSTVALSIFGSCPLLTCRHQQVFPLKDHLINPKQLSIMLWLIR